MTMNWIVYEIMHGSETTSAIIETRKIIHINQDAADYARCRELLWQIIQSVKY